MATFTSTMTGASADYMRYLYGNPQKTDRYKDPTLLDFSLAPIDSSFVKLTRGSYITLSVSGDTATSKWFTGYIINDPELTYLGKKAGAPVFGYTYQATSDEYLLNIKALTVVPTILNKPMGQIIKLLVQLLCPSTFDITNVQDGPLVAKYDIDTTKKFSDVVSELCAAANYVFRANNKYLYFYPQDSATITLDANDKHFTPSRLTISPSSSPVINDVTVQGDEEPQAYVTEYFIGTGLDSAFPLISGVYGADGAVLLDEQFQSSQINGSTWTVQDVVQNWLQVSNGYLNVLGGSSNGSYDIHIRSSNPIPLEGHLRFTHGEWDFLPASGAGIIAGCWTNTPSSTLTDCLFGLKYTAGSLSPIVQGTVDSTQSAAVDTSKRYVIRTIAEFSKANRASQSYSYVNSSGTVSQVVQPTVPDNSAWETMITEIDPATGKVTKQWTFKNSIALTGVSDAYAVYAPAVSDNLHATVTGITISNPINATLEMADLVGINNQSFDAWEGTIATGWSTPICVVQDTSISSGAAKFLVTSPVVIPYIYQPLASAISPNVSYTVTCKLARNSGSTSGSLQIYLAGTGVSTTGLNVNTVSIPPGAFTSSWQTFTATLTTGLATVPDDLVLKIAYVGGSTGNYVLVDDVMVSSAWARKLVGPNEMDSIDGQAPVATVVQPGGGQQPQLVFFKDSLTQNSDTPLENQLIRFTYRGAGQAIGRVVDLASVQAEAVKWGDDGYRAAIRTDLKPTPRNSLDCESAASALVQENSTQHYDGTYTQFSTYFTTEPKAGSILKFTNFSNYCSVTAEEISEVVTTLESKTDLRTHEITFGKPDKIQAFLSKFDTVLGAPQITPDAIPEQVIDYRAVGTTFAPDVTKPILTDWDDNHLYVDAGQDLGSNGLYYEVRYTDTGWGADDGKNLVTRSTTRSFTVPRDLRGKVFFIRQANAGNYIPYSEDQTQASVYSGIAATKATSVNPDGNLSTVCSIPFTGSNTFTATVSIPIAYTDFCWSFSIKGTAGKTVTATFGTSTATYTLNGRWQRFSLSLHAVGGGSKTCSLKANQAVTAQVTRYSVEGGTTTERYYTKTNVTPYGPVSRYSAAMHVSFPLVGETVVDDVRIDVSSNTTLDPVNQTVRVDASSGSVTITLPSFDLMSGKRVTVVKIDTTGNTVTVTAQGSDTIASDSSVVLNTQYDLVEVRG